MTSMERPTISSAAYPNSFSAAAFQLVTIPSTDILKMASPEPSTMAESCWRTSSARFSSVVSVTTMPIPSTWSSTVMG